MVYLETDVDRSQLLNHGFLLEGHVPSMLRSRIMNGESSAKNGKDAIIPESTFLKRSCF